MHHKEEQPKNYQAAEQQPNEIAHPSLSEIKRQAVMAAANRQPDPKVDARVAFGFMPMSMKGAAIRWRGL